MKATQNIYQVGENNYVNLKYDLELYRSTNIYNTKYKNNSIVNNLT